MAMGMTSRRGYTLVEILIVVAILGILASMVLPLFTNASDMARNTATKALLSTLRTQFEVYKVQHREGYPQLSALWVNLIEKTNADGNLDPSGRFGGYLTKPPVHPFTGSSTAVAPGTETITDGWTYDETSGAIHAVGFDESTGLFTGTAVP